MSLKDVTLDDKYTLAKGRIFMTGTQALVRLAMTQHLRDAHAGLNTAGYMSGYRGSPLGTLDEQLAKARKFLDLHNLVFVPGANDFIDFVNEPRPGRLLPLLDSLRLPLSGAA